MNFLLWGITLGTVGKLVLGFAVLRVHVYIIQEHKIDGVVVAALKREQFVTLFGLLLILVGYILEVSFYFGFTNLLTCTGRECLGAISSAFTK